jgi:hypothetical protein
MRLTGSGHDGWVYTDSAPRYEAESRVVSPLGVVKLAALMSRTSGAPKPAPSGADEKLADMALGPDCSISVPEQMLTTPITASCCSQRFF